MAAVKKYAGIAPAGKGRWRVSARVRVDGKISAKESTITGTLEDAKLHRSDLIRELRNGKGSLTLPTKRLYNTFGEVVEFYLTRKGMGGGMRTILDKLNRELGHVEVAQFGQRFDAWLQILRVEASPITGRQRSPTTINRYVMVARLVFGYACKRPQCDLTGITDNPVKGYEMALEEGRDRVWTDAERVRLFATLKKLDSPLYWLVYFCQWNPIRRGDLLTLTRNNLDMLKPWVHFYPSKTRKRKPRETALVCIDDALLGYFQSLPEDCPLLFPKLGRDGSWRPFGEFKRHWATVCNEANIPDFHWHDLKHCAETYLLDNGFSERDLMNLGIQYDRKMIDRYYHRSADKGLNKWKSVQGVKTSVNDLGPKMASTVSKTA